MSRVLIIVEGPTERAIIQNVLSPYLNSKGIYLYPKVIGRPGHKGGIRDFESVLREITALIHQEPTSFISTFFDFYALPRTWPGVNETKGKKPPQIPAILETEITKAVKNKLKDSFNQARFIPYIQIYELEALLFAGPKEMAEVFEKPKLEEKFEGIIKECGGCENINDNPNTAPSKRIEKLFPSYKKGGSVNAHAHIIASQIGIEKIRKQCPNFDNWISKLENLT